MISAVIFAGGVGKRMGSADIPKQFLEIEGKSIIIRTMEHFEKHAQVDKIVVACVEDWISELEKQIKYYGLKKVEAIVLGGESGFTSIHNGLVRVSEYSKGEDIVLICDGVRPVLTEMLITNCISKAMRYETAVPVTPSIDSLLFSEDGNVCQKNYQRNSMYITQAPQGYTLKKILWAHKEAEKRGIVNPISSCDLIIELGEPVHIYKGNRENVKVTTPEDLDTLRAHYYYQHYKLFAKEALKYGL